MNTKEEIYPKSSENALEIEAKEEKPEINEPRKEVVIDPAKKELIVDIRKNLVAAAPYQAFIGAILLILPWVILNPLSGMDLMYPYIYIPVIPIYRAVGTVIVVLAVLQFVFALVFEKVYEADQKICGILAMLIAVLMLPLIPTGTYFGLLVLQDFKSLKEDTVQVEERDLTLEDKHLHVQKTLTASSLVMLHMPIILLLLYAFIIMLPIDMAYPFASAEATSLWELIGWILLGIYLLQFVIARLYPHIVKKPIDYLVVWIFAVFQIIALGIFVQGFITISAPALEFEGGMLAIVYLSWLIGVLLNPIGIHFGLTLWRQGADLRKAN